MTTGSQFWVSTEWQWTGWIIQCPHSMISTVQHVLPVRNACVCVCVCVRVYITCKTTALKFCLEIDTTNNFFFINRACSWCLWELAWSRSKYLESVWSLTSDSWMWWRGLWRPTLAAYRAACTMFPFSTSGSCMIWSLCLYNPGSKIILGASLTSLDRPRYSPQL